MTHAPPPAPLPFPSVGEVTGDGRGDRRVEESVLFSDVEGRLAAVVEVLAGEADVDEAEVGGEEGLDDVRGFEEVKDQLLTCWNWMY